MKRRQLNPRQRQGLLLVLIACAGLVAVFVLIANYVSTVSKQVGPKMPVLTLIRQLAPYQAVSTSDLGETSLPKKWAPGNALTSPDEALGLISQVQLPAGTDLEQGMLTQPPALVGNEREIAILVDTETGVAGQVQPGSVVDVVATYGGGTSLGNIKPVAEVVVDDVKVLGVGTAASGSEAGALASGAQNQGLPVTLALTPAQVLKVSFAESFGQKVRLSLVAPGYTGRASNPPPYSAFP